MSNLRPYDPSASACLRGQMAAWRVAAGNPSLTELTASSGLSYHTVTCAMRSGNTLMPRTRSLRILAELLGHSMPELLRVLANRLDAPPASEQFVPEFPAPADVLALSGLRLDDPREADRVIAQVLQYLREAQQLTASEVGRRAGFPGGTVSRWEAHRLHPAARALPPMAAAVGVSPGEFLRLVANRLAQPATPVQPEP